MHKIYLYAKELNEPKYQYLIKKREDVGMKYLKDPKTFIEYSQHMDDFYNNIILQSKQKNKNFDCV